MTAAIAVTTTADRFHHWASPLAERGFRPVSLPCLRIVPTAEVGEAQRIAATADWLVITSPRVVQVMWPNGGMPPVAVAAVGSGSARAVRAAHGTPSVVGDGDGDRLVDLVGERMEDKRVVIPHGALADARRFRRLAERGAHVETVAVYETVPAAPGSEPVDGAVFGSPSAVAGWLLSRAFDALQIIGGIGEVTAEALRRHGANPVVPDRPSPERLAAALSATLERIR